MQSIDAIETYAYGTNKKILYLKEEVKFINIIKLHEKWWTMMMLWKKILKNIIQIGLKFLINHTEY